MTTLPRNWFGRLDALLRGEGTRVQDLVGGSLRLPLRSLVPMCVILGVIYGFFMGWFALARTWGQVGKVSDGWLQAFASMVKVPLLFAATLLVTFPSLYVFNALMGCRLTFQSTLRLLVAAITVNLAVAASFGPIVAFFTLSTTSYPFMQLLNIVMLGTAGLIGLGFLLKVLRRVGEAASFDASVKVREASDRSVEVNADESLSAEEKRDRLHAMLRTQDDLQLAQEQQSSANRIFFVWIVIYALVGSQMGWLLRPFIGHPSAKFTWFRPRTGSFFHGFLDALYRLVSSALPTDVLDLWFY